MANDYYKMCSISLAIGEMQIKTILRHHIAPVRMTLINKFDNKMLETIWRTGNHCSSLVGVRVNTTMWKLDWRFLQNLKIELSYDPSVPPGHIFIEIHTLSQRCLYTHVYCCLIRYSKGLESI